MTSPTCSTPRRRWLLALLALLAACGGVDSGGTGTGSTSPTLAVGPIGGFGSVIVNGVRFDDSAAAIVDEDGAAVPRERLRLGMQLEVQASAVETVGGIATATASAITVRSEVLGPIEAIDAAARTLVVLGQAVVLPGSAALDEPLAAFARGDVVAVHGTEDPARSRIVATRVERAGAVGAYTLRGRIGSVSLSGRTLTIGGATIDWSAAAPEDPAALLVPGASIRVALATVPSATGAWRATALRRSAVPLGDRDRVELEGRVTAFRSDTSFDVAGIPVDASAASFPEGRTGLALGVRVEVEGSARDGVLVARSVQLEDDEAAGSLEIQGTIESVQASERRFVVRGTTVAWSDTTRFDSGGPERLVAGRRVALRGTLSADGTRVDAASIHVED